MADSVEVRTPSASAVIGGESKGIDGVACSFGINSFPAVQVFFHDVGPGVTKMGAADTVARVGAQQAGMFAEKDANNTVTMNDGRTELEFRGLMSSPNYELGVGSVGLSTTLVDEASLMANFNPSIYRTLITFSDQELEALRQRFTISSNVAGNMAYVLELMTAEWQNIGPDTESRKINELIHTNNEQPRKIWDAITGASAVTWPELGKLADGAASTAGVIFNQIHQLYLNSYGAFTNTVEQLRGQFNLIYVPGISSGDYGRLISIEDATNGDGAGLTLKNVRFKINAGTTSATPLAYVMMRGPKSDMIRVGEAAGTIVARWPPGEAASSGKAEEVGMPQWFPRQLALSEEDIDTEVSEYLSSSGYKSSSWAVEGKLRQLQIVPARELLTRLCRHWYVDLCLSPSQAVVTTDLDFSLRPGTRYAVSSSQGPLFKGFLARVEHYMSSKPGSLQASTTLFFTYVEGAGFSLPNKE